jgi:hypothetical protein
MFRPVSQRSSTISAVTGIPSASHGIPLVATVPTAAPSPDSRPAMSHVDASNAPRRSNALDLDQTFRGFAAVGMYLQAGVKLAIDRGRPFQIPYSWCLINACIAADLADAKLINEMDAARA